MKAVTLCRFQQMDIEYFCHAYDIDPDYAKLLKKAIKHGVEVLAT